MFVCSAFYQLLRALLKPRLSLVTENLALGQQLVILRRNKSRPGLRDRERLGGLVESVVRLASILFIVKPETAIKWHRQGFKCDWRWKSRAARVGRPRIDQEIRDLIRRMSREKSDLGSAACEGGLPTLTRYFATVDSATL
jgi:hypothetical protein